MAEANRFVTGVRQVRSVEQPGADSEPAVTFENGRDAAVSPHIKAEHHRRLLTQLHESGHPAYVELQETSPATPPVVVCVHVPLIVQVRKLIPADAGVFATFETSHAAHLLRRDSPRFQELLNLLTQALETSGFVAVTESPTDKRIIDVTPVPPPDDSPVLVDSPTAAGKRTPSDHHPSPSPQELFDLVAADSCDPTNPESPCIPFLFPHDGCWARAHEMCRLMEGAGAAPRKIWISGVLRPRTTNDPTCAPSWSFHVAPLVGAGGHEQVIDPTICNGPVSRETWIGLLNATAYAVVETDATRYRPHAETDFGDGHNVWTLDSDFRHTRQDLSVFRGQLADQTDANGPPPFACPDR
jgi:hypothetical protein